MDIGFSAKRLERASLDFAESSRIFGVPIGRKYIQRVLVLRAAENFSQLFGIQSLKLHSLKVNRAGQYAITLTGNYRLILEKAGEDKILIVDVEDYHGD
jgi:plasmid maintenance system killer protein